MHSVKLQKYIPNFLNIYNPQLSYGNIYVTLVYSLCKTTMNARL